MGNDQFKEKIKTGVTLVDFTANWCAPCKAQDPILEKLALTYEHRASIMGINIDENRSLATSYRVQSIPTLIIFKNGREIKRLVGLQSEAAIVKSLERAI